MAKSNDPFWWALFAAGGMVAAFLLPITIVLTGIAVPAGWLSEAALFDLIHHPLVRLYLVVIIALPLFHAAHRIRFTLVETGLKSAKGLLAWICYGAAILGTFLGAFLILRM